MLKTKDKKKKITLFTKISTFSKNNGFKYVTDGTNGDCTGDFRHGTRVRIHGDVARIECLPGYIEKIILNSDREHIIDNLKILGLGFRFVSLDLEGYRRRSSNPEKGGL